MSFNFSSSLFYISILLYIINSIQSIPTKDLGETKPCKIDNENKICEKDGYVGSKIIYEDEKVRIWDFTLAPGDTTSMHSHDSDYYFVAVKPTQLEVYGENGDRLFDFRAEGAMGFRVNGDYLEPINTNFPMAPSALKSNSLSPFSP